MLSSATQSIAGLDRDSRAGTEADATADDDGADDDADALTLLRSSDSITTQVPHPMSSQEDTFPALRKAASSLRLCSLKSVFILSMD